MDALKQSGYQFVNGINLYYEIYGEGNPLVLIHGGGSSSFFDFEEVVKRMYNQFQLILIDLQNHGKSDHRDIPETFEQDAKDVIAVLENIGIEKASFFGFSNGATTSLKIAELFPQKVEKLVFASGNTKRSGLIDGFFEGMLASSVDDMPEYLKINFLKLNPDPLKFYNMYEKDSQRMVYFKDFEDEVLESIKSPVFIIAGDKDVVKTEHFVELSKKIPNNQLMILPANHGNYMMKDENGNINSRLIDFTVSEITHFLLKID